MTTKMSKASLDRMSVSDIKTRIRDLNAEHDQKDALRAKYKEENHGTPGWYRSNIYSNWTTRMYHIREEVKRLEGYLSERSHNKSAAVQ